MPFFVTCGCGEQMVVADELAGTTVRCSRCDTPLSLPAVSSPPPPSPDTASIEDVDPTSIVIQTHLEAPRPRIDPNVRRVRIVAVGLVALALVGLIPVLVDALLARDVETSGWERWATVACWFSLLEVGYAIYVWQLADWSALRVVSWMTVLVAGVYAMAAAFRGLAANGNRVTAFWDLDGNAFSSSQEVLWCFLMVVLTGLLSYVAGTWSAQWGRLRAHSSAER